MRTFTGMLLGALAFGILWSTFDLVEDGRLSEELPFLVVYVVTGIVVIPLTYFLSLAAGTPRLPRLVLFPSALWFVQCGVFAFGYLSNDIYEVGGTPIVRSHGFTPAGWSLFALYAACALLISIVVTVVVFGIDRRQTPQ